MRYAIYFAPGPLMLLHHRGSSWLGRDAYTGDTPDQPHVEGIAQLTAEPRRYGFHATLKAPFALRDGVEPEALMRACAALAASIRAVTVRLKPQLLDGFLALVPDGDQSEVNAVEARCLTELDGFRKPPSNAELARRRSAPLTARQEAHLLRWGYPYVLEDFRFHMTLTQRLEPGDQHGFLASAHAHFAPAIDEPVCIDGITLFQEPAAGLPFFVLQHFPFTHSLSEAAA